MRRLFLSALLFALFGTFALAQTEVVVFLDPRSPMELVRALRARL